MRKKQKNAIGKGINTMSDVREYGEVYTSDILIVGGGVAGLTAAIQIKRS